MTTDPTKPGREDEAALAGMDRLVLEARADAKKWLGKYEESQVALLAARKEAETWQQAFEAAIKDKLAEREIGYTARKEAAAAAEQLRQELQQARAERDETDKMYEDAVIRHDAELQQARDRLSEATRAVSAAVYCITCHSYTAASCDCDQANIARAFLARPEQEPGDTFEAAQERVRPIVEREREAENITGNLLDFRVGALLERWGEPCPKPCDHAHCPLLREIRATLVPEQEPEPPRENCQPETSAFPCGLCPACLSAGSEIE